MTRGLVARVRGEVRAPALAPYVDAGADDLLSVLGVAGIESVFDL